MVHPALSLTHTHWGGTWQLEPRTLLLTCLWKGGAAAHVTPVQATQLRPQPTPGSTCSRVPVYLMAGCSCGLQQLVHRLISRTLLSPASTLSVSMHLEGGAAARNGCCRLCRVLPIARHGQQTTPSGPCPGLAAAARLGPPMLQCCRTWWPAMGTACMCVVIAAGWLSLRGAARRPFGDSRLSAAMEGTVLWQLVPCTCWKPPTPTPQPFKALCFGSWCPALAGSCPCPPELLRVLQVNSLREIQALRRLSPHANIIKLLEVLYDQPTGRLALVFELMDMNVYELIRGRRHYVAEERVKSYMYQLMKSMDHMHRNGIFHRWAPAADAGMVGRNAMHGCVDGCVDGCAQWWAAGCRWGQGGAAVQSNRWWGQRGWAEQAAGARMGAGGRCRCRR
jgi:hypothetical protein